MNLIMKPLIALAAVTFISSAALAPLGSSALAGSHAKKAGSGALTEDAAMKKDTMEKEAMEKAAMEKAAMKKKAGSGTLSKDAMAKEAMEKSAMKKDGMEKDTMAEPAAMMKKETKRGSGDN